MTAAPRAWYCVTDAAAIPVREGRRVRFRDHDVALFNLGDHYAAVANRCPHRQGPLADGIVAGTSVFCPLHAWKVCLGSGKVLAGGEGQVKTYPVKVIDQKVYVAFEDGSSSTQEPASCP